MELDKVIKERRSVRYFENKEVSLDDISKILDCARLSPSSGNVQNWSFIIVKDKINEIAELSYDQNWIKTSSCLIVVCSRMKEISKLYGDKGKNLFAIQNCAIASYAIMLKAKDLGIGSCWIGAFDYDAVKELLDIGKDIDVQAIIALGYGRSAPRYEREILDSIVYFEKWKNKKRDYSIWPLKKYIGGKLKRLNKR